MKIGTAERNSTFSSQGEAIALSPASRELLVPAVVWGATMLAVAVAARSPRLRPVLA